MAICLMYHNVVETNGDRETFHPAHRPYVTTRAEFEGHLDTALSAGYSFIEADDLFGEAPLEQKSILLTFDDSWENHCATEAMEQKGIRGVFFLNSGDIGLDKMLTAEEVEAFAQRGHEIGSHGVSHEFLTNLDDDALAKSLSESKEVLEGLTKKPARFISAPGGRYDSRVERAARTAGYEAFFTSWPGFLSRVTTHFIVKRMSISMSMDLDALTRMLANPCPLVLRRKVKYRIHRFTSRFSNKHGGEGH